MVRVLIHSTLALHARGGLQTVWSLSTPTLDCILEVWWSRFNANQLVQINWAALDTMTIV